MKLGLMTPLLFLPKSPVANKAVHHHLMSNKTSPATADTPDTAQEPEWFPVVGARLPSWNSELKTFVTETDRRFLKKKKKKKN